MTKKTILAVALGGVIALGACSDSSNNGLTGSGAGRLNVQLTDAPTGDLKAAFIKIDKIILERSDADSATADSTRRIEFTPTTSGYINVLNLTGGKLLDLLNNASVSNGTYSEMRVVVTDAYVVLNDGRTFATSTATLPAGVTAAGTLKCPSCAQSGYKVFFTNGGLTVAGNSTVVLDFDAAQTFGHEAGKSGQWIMHPVLRATATTIRFANVTGQVAVKDTTVKIPQCGAQANTLVVFKPLAISGADTLSGVVDTTGAFKIANVLPGTYTLSYAKDVTYTNGDSLTFTATPSVATVTVAQGDSAKANYTVTAASCH